MPTIQQILAIQKRVQFELMKKKNVVGVGIGYKMSNHRTTGEIGLVVFVSDKLPAAQLASRDVIPKAIKGVVTDVKPVGRIIIHKSRTERWRPAPPGVSIGHEYVTAGTFGAVVRDNATGKKLILSNNHVLANSNDARKKDAIVQPGPIDGGRAPQDLIAQLERFVPISFKKSETNVCSIAARIAKIANYLAARFGSKSRLAPFRIEDAVNVVDAAVASPWGDSITDEILNLGTVHGIAEPELNMKVRKSGRTTAVTEGTITSLNTMVEVGYGNGKSAIFENQIITTNMSAPGDSGSLLVTADGNNAVGLLFAGSNEVTVFNPIQQVLDLLEVHFE
ncbi:MAG: S1 family peptidase [candidate division KSB1 bacterium]|nr:S1 family peptidase [candidate division KSB1 bacterium]MDZ7356946.1 S1 family peptidase [candidate division KSB1 bacterium]MDZ7375492.1 S1 family peptidase [candidate division KSB1 bacterium]MDZ7400099.1 S1 family peptidase [candidate division KSB1 bacterium]